MDHSKLRSLAGIPRLNYAESKQLEERLTEAKAKAEVPEVIFTKKAKSIVKTLVKLNDGDKKKALKALNAYLKTCDKDCGNTEELEKAKASLKEGVDFEEMNIFRLRAGLQPLVEKKEEETPDDDAPAEGEEDKDAKEEDEDDLPSIVKKLAKKAVGKEEEELEELLMKVYEAGFSDGKKAKDEESDESAEDEEGTDKKAKEKDAE